ncbi:adenylate cyclase type 10-like isoform X1 [Saccopteryx bilineata]|uniref:adenylate cyclase type 10-like isoform X1 n=1 Tax=Saccopteryx bilineata TaxID=59482 RepID=UPI00338E6FF9
MDMQKDESEDRTIARVAAHLPDLILYGPIPAERPSVMEFDGTLMFVDISGFTAMTEKFSRAMYMDRGAEQLVGILNHHLSGIVETVLLYGGDILKFAGDALLALWKVERTQLKSIITLVIRCSLKIHQLFRLKESEEGLKVRVKIGLAAGHISMLVFGDEARDFFLVTGQTVDDVRRAQDLAQVNDVVLSPNCWQLCDRSMVEIERIPDARAVKVLFLKPPSTFNFDEFFRKCMTFMENYPSGDKQNLLRLACSLESDPELELSLQKYVMESIWKQINDKQLRGYLSELRPVTIMFVNLMFKNQDKAEVIGSAIQDSCVYISSVLRVFQSQINKVFMFDKGCSFLCVFGLPGEKVPDEVTHALESAVNIFDFCSQVQEIHTVSIGVTSGIVFCGIIGHSMRHEYTVIGQKVNTAARMMTYYPGIVTCDSVTYNSSSLPAYLFKELPKKVMKGVADSGPIYQCLGLKEEVVFVKGDRICNRKEGYPLLGRDKELQYCQYSLEKFLMSSCSHILMYEGRSGLGKSKILMEVESLLQDEKHRTIAIALSKIGFHQNFYTIQKLMASVLGLDACRHYRERQTSLQSQVQSLMDERFYCIFNDIFRVQFPVSQEVSKITTLRKQKQLEELFMKILEKIAKQERMIFMIDEGQFMDSASWAFLEKLIQNVPVFIIMTLSPFIELPCLAASAIMRNRHTTYIALGAMQPGDICKKVCLDLGVTGISTELELYLASRSCGVPLFCEEILKNLQQHRALVCRQIEVEEKANVTWNQLIKNFAKPTEELKIFTLGGENVCELASGVRLKDLSLPLSLKEISLVQLDSMSLSHQMLVRCAAILGLAFTKELLFEILPCWEMKRMIKALATLVETNIFDCFRNNKELQLALKHNVASFEVNHRSLSLNPTEGMAHSEELRELENEVIACHIIHFSRPMMQKTAYELWLKSEKEAMHLTCARFLEQNAHKCDQCHGGDFIPYHHFAMDTQLSSLDMDIIQKMARAKGFKAGKETTLKGIEIPSTSDIFLENLSFEEITKKILSFFDITIKKMSPSQEVIVPLEHCQCEETLELVLVPLVYHFLALRQNNKAMYYILEAASACLAVDDNYMAYKYLNEGERMLKGRKKKASWSHPFESATFYSLKGQVYYNMGHMVLAKKMLRKALQLLNRDFPDNLISLFICNRVEKNRHIDYMSQEAQETPPPGKKRLAELYQQNACFSLLWKIYSINDHFHYKYYRSLAAQMEVNTALDMQDDFQITKAYLDYSLHYQMTYQSLWDKYEVSVMELISSLPLKGESIEIVAYVADTLGYTKFTMGYLDLAIDLGSRAQHMWALLHHPNKRYKVLCWLGRCLFLQNRYKHLAQVLGWLWDLSVKEDNICSKAIFYFLCLDIILYSGFIYRPFDECLEFIHQNEDNRILKFQNGLLLGLYSCVAVWYARLQKWDTFQLFFKKAKNLVPRRTPTALYLQGMCSYMEARILHLPKEIENQPTLAQDSCVEVLKDLNRLVTLNTTGTVFYPRLYHLTAYVCILMGDGENCDRFLNSALELCLPQGNVLEACWLDMNRDWWYISCQQTEEDQWRRTILSLPSWEEIASGKVNTEAIQKSKFLMRVNLLDDPFY